MESVHENSSTRTYERDASFHVLFVFQSKEKSTKEGNHLFLVKNESSWIGFLFETSRKGTCEGRRSTGVISSSPSCPFPFELHLFSCLRFVPPSTKPKSFPCKRLPPKQDVRPRLDYIIVPTHASSSALHVPRSRTHRRKHTNAFHGMRGLLSCSFKARLSWRIASASSYRWSNKELP